MNLELLCVATWVSCGVCVVVDTIEVEFTIISAQSADEPTSAELYARFGGVDLFTRPLALRSKVTYGICFLGDAGEVEFTIPAAQSDDDPTSPEL